MVGVHFTEVDQFLDELDKHAENPSVLINRSVVRATPVYRTDMTGVRTVTILASFVSTRELSATELIHVVAYVGQLWGQEQSDEQTTERRDALMDAIGNACERHGLELRQGWYEAPH